MEYHYLKQNYSQWNITNLTDVEDMTYSLFVPTTNQGKNKIIWLIQVADSFFQVWGALHKAWKGYVIAKNKDEYEKMEHYHESFKNHNMT